MAAVGDHEDPDRAAARRRNAETHVEGGVVPIDGGTLDPDKTQFGGVAGPETAIEDTQDLEDDRTYVAEPTDERSVDPMDRTAADVDADLTYMPPELAEEEEEEYEEEDSGGGFQDDRTLVGEVTAETLIEHGDAEMTYMPAGERAAGAQEEEYEEEEYEEEEYEEEDSGGGFQDDRTLVGEVTAETLIEHGDAEMTYMPAAERTEEEEDEDEAPRGGGFQDDRTLVGEVAAETLVEHDDVEMTYMPATERAPERPPAGGFQDDRTLVGDEGPDAFRASETVLEHDDAEMTYMPAAERVAPASSEGSTAEATVLEDAPATRPAPPEDPEAELTYMPTSEAGPAALAATVMEEGTAPPVEGADETRAPVRPAHDATRLDATGTLEGTTTSASVSETSEPSQTLTGTRTRRARPQRKKKVQRKAKSKPATDLPTQRAQSGPDGELFAGKYRLLGEIARGGMGVVYTAVHVDLNQKLALKVMLAGAHATKKARQRFLFEGQASARLKHPNIVPVFDIGAVGEKLYFTMGLVKGEELKDRAKTLDRPQLLEVMIKVCDGVNYAHRRGIIHRDLKPGNVMMNEENTPLIMDFGLAKQLGEEEDDDLDASDGPKTMEGSVMGTPHYMSPEQASGKISEVDTRTDVYALGVMLFKLWTNEYPFSAKNAGKLITKIILEEAVRPRDVDATVDMDFEAIILKCIEKNADARYATAGALKEDLERYRDGLPISARRATAVYRFQKWARRNRERLAMASALLLVITLGLSGLAYRSHTARVAEAQRIQTELDGAASTLATLRSASSDLGARVGTFFARPATVDDRRAALAPLLAELEGESGLLERLERGEDPVAAHVETQEQAATLRRSFAEVRLELRAIRTKLKTLAGVHAELGLATEKLGLAGVQRDEALTQLKAAKTAIEAPTWANLEAAVAGCRRRLEATLRPAPVGAGEYEAVSQALDAQLDGVRRHAFTALRSAPATSPEAEESKRRLNEVVELRRQVDVAHAKTEGIRIATEMRTCALALAALIEGERKQYTAGLRARHLEASGLAQVMAQRALEADVTLPGLREALLAVNATHARSTLLMKAYNVFNVQIAATGALSEADRTSLLAERKVVVKRTLALRHKLEAKGLKVRVITGKIEGASANRTTGMTLFKLKLRVKQLKKLEHDEYMDDELEAQRRSTLAKAEQTARMAAAKYAIDKAIVKLKRVQDKLTPAQVAEGLAGYLAGWTAVEQERVKRTTDLLPALLAPWKRPDPAEVSFAKQMVQVTAEKFRNEILKEQAGLHRRASLGLEASDPKRALQHAEQALALYQQTSPGYLPTSSPKHACDTCDRPYLHDLKEGIRRLKTASGD